ncbi:MAG: nucleotidyltransferase domain-containing protein [Defluviitaleaceae bacterium]|nr:nucleotidyltransferase domain-containing protein [Defluviitaleaceae bacterium]
MIDYDLIRAVFENHTCIKKAVLFGSRAMGTHKKYSDIDIALFGEFESDQVSRISNELEELPMIQKIDIVSYGSITNLDLRDHIDRVGQVVFEQYHQGACSK